MSEGKKHSADEIRRVADRLEASEVAKEIYLMVGNSLANDEYHGRDIVDILRQAADAECELVTLKARVAELELYKKRVEEDIRAAWKSAEDEKSKREEVEIERDSLKTSLAETRRKWLCHETACKTCDCRVSKLDKTGRTDFLCDCSKQDGVTANDIVGAAKAACVGIVSELLKCDKSLGLDVWKVADDTGINTTICGDGGMFIAEDDCFSTIDAKHIVALHNIWLKAVTAFGANGKVPQRNCEKFPSFDAALEAFLAFCPNEQGKPCDDCPYEGEYSCMGRWLMDQEKGEGK